MKKILNIFTASLLLILPLTVSSQIPHTLSYQGVLTDNAGKPRPDGNYAFTFRLYNTTSGGTVIWSEQKILPIKGGLFSTALGDQTPFGPAVKFDRPYWLSIQVGNEPELAPRIPLTSVGYSMSSLRADTARVAMNTSNVIHLPFTIDLTDLSASNGRDALFVKASPDNDVGVLLVNKPGFALWSVENNNLADLECRALTSRAALTIDLTSASGPNGRDVLFLKSSADNNISTILTNTTKIALWSVQKQNLADFECARASASVLEIRGGADLAEPFEMSHTEPLPTGALVVIDKYNPGKLKLATESYNKRVAGVISGAGGINPGLTLQQEGVLAGGQHVALTGKVYALATAANGAIEPGDLLTTSSVPGHAMKATDQARWPGAVIGKAMSSLNEGEGLVLVLVNLQ